MIAGGPAPLIAVHLFAQTNSPYSIGAYILVCCVIGFVAFPPEPMVCRFQTHTR